MTDTRSDPQAPRTAARRKRPHAAIGARVAAAGLGASAMFGIVSLMGVVNSYEIVDSTDPDASLLPSTPGTPVVVRVYTMAPGQGGAEAPDGSPIVATPIADGPIELTASPVARTVEAPVARSNGSR